MVPRDRRPGGLACGAAASGRIIAARILCSAVPLTESDPQVPPVRALQHGVRSSVRVEAIHDAEGYRVRSVLADSYDVSANEPDIQIVDVDLLGDRPLVLRHTPRNGVRLAESSAR